MLKQSVTLDGYIIRQPQDDKLDGRTDGHIFQFVLSFWDTNVMGGIGLRILNCVTVRSSTIA